MFLLHFKGYKMWCLICTTLVFKDNNGRRPHHNENITSTVQHRYNRFLLAPWNPPHNVDTSTMDNKGSNLKNQSCNGPLPEHLTWNFTRFIFTLHLWIKLRNWNEVLAFTVQTSTLSHVFSTLWIFCACEPSMSLLLLIVSGFSGTKTRTCSYSFA